MVSAPAMHPLTRLIRIAARFFFSTRICLYMGMARQTVDGVRKYVIYCAPLLKVS